MIPPGIRAAFVAALGLAVLAPPAPAPAADTYKVDAVHSSVVYRVKHMQTSYSYGRFNQLEGSFTLDAADRSKCAVDVKVKTSSVDSANDKRDQHLLGPDFFNAKQFPTIAFKSTKFVQKSDNVFDVSGELTLHGVTKPVTITLEKTGSAKSPMGEVAGVETVFTIKRSDFGMKNAIPMIGDDVKLMVSLEGGKK